MEFSREAAAELLARAGFFWLDLDRPDTDAFDTLREVLGFHPLAVEDSEQFDQACKAGGLRRLRLHRRLRRLPR